MGISSRRRVEILLHAASNVTLCIYSNLAPTSTRLSPNLGQKCRPNEHHRVCGQKFGLQLRAKQTKLRLLLIMVHHWASFLETHTTDRILSVCSPLEVAWTKNPKLLQHVKSLNGKTKSLSPQGFSFGAWCLQCNSCIVTLAQLMYKSKFPWDRMVQHLLADTSGTKTSYSI
jgi:hypothetical protein